MPATTPLRPSATAIAAVIAALAPLAARAQTGAAPPAASGWRACSAIAGDDAARLACFDRWAGAQAWQAPAAHASSQPEPPAPPVPPRATAASEPAALQTGCRDGSASTLSRYWELERASDCGALRFRGYRPLSVSVASADQINRQPSSANPRASASAPVDYRHTEMRVQLSVRTKLAKGLLTDRDPERLDSLWFGYTQQSYWQLFSPAISRPFRTTDHEPELVYVYPATLALPWGWRWRYSGLGLVHQSNGQSLPLSRSWNRVYLMGGMELGDRWALTGRVWRRLSEHADNDDNPDISNYVGRAELALRWNVNPEHTLTLSARHALRSAARGSLRLEWLHTLGSRWVGSRSNLRLHTQLFSGYGDSLIDYNRRRTVFSVGLSLVDF